MDVLDQLANYEVDGNGCWIYLGYCWPKHGELDVVPKIDCGPDSKPRFRTGQRVMWELERNVLLAPKELIIHCSLNSKCINPEHLRPGDAHDARMHRRELSGENFAHTKASGLRDPRLSKGRKVGYRLSPEQLKKFRDKCRVTWDAKKASK